MAKKKLQKKYLRKKSVQKKPVKKKEVVSKKNIPKKNISVPKKILNKKILRPKKEIPKSALRKQSAEVRALDKKILQYLRVKRDLSISEEMDLKTLVERKKGMKKVQKKEIIYIPPKEKSAPKEPEGYDLLNTFNFWEVSPQINNLNKDHWIYFNFEAFRKIFEFAKTPVSRYEGNNKIKNFYITIFSIVTKIGQLTKKERSTRRASDPVRFLFNLYQKIDFKTGELKYRLIGEYL